MHGWDIMQRIQIVSGECWVSRLVHSILRFTA